MSSAPTNRTPSTRPTQPSVSPAIPPLPGAPAAAPAGPAVPAGSGSAARDSFTTGSAGAAPRKPEEILQDAVAARQARARTTQIQVERGIQSDASRYGSDLGGWLKDMGDKLASRDTVLKLSDKIQVKSGDELKALQERAGTDLRGLAADLGIQPREVNDYLADLHQLVDDLVRPGSQLQGGVVDASVGSEVDRALGLDSGTKSYAAAGTNFAAQPADKVSKLKEVELSGKAFDKAELKDKTYMDSSTFSGSRASSERSSVELEVVKTIGGLSTPELVKLMRTDRGGRTVYDRMAKPEHASSFGVGYEGMGVDELRWDSDAHALREKNPYVSLTVEGGRMEKDARTGQREVSLGKDFNIDRYYDTPDFALLGSDMSLRTRVRMDNPGEIRRILVQSKLGSGVDENGIKSCEKKDIRVDMASWDQAGKLDESVRSGINQIKSWGSPEPIEAVQAVYQGMKDKALLADVGDKKDVLQLEEKAVINSIRGRYHLNFTDDSAMKKLMNECGKPMISRVRELTEAAGPGLDAAVKRDIIATAKGLEDGSALAKACEAELKKLDPNMIVDATTVGALLPGTPGATDQLSMTKRKLVADTQSRLYHEFSDKFDQARREISGASDRTSRDLAKGFTEWKRNTDDSLKPKQSARPFLDAFDKMKDGADVDAQIAAYNSWAKQNDQPALTKPELTKLRAGLVNEDLDIMHRQIESAGSMGQAVWFRQATDAFVPGHSEWGNFLIDTFDMTEAVKPADFAKLTPAQQQGKERIPADQVFRASVVNELQIELGLEKPYLDRIGALKKDIAEGRGTPDTQRQLEMCQFIYKQLMDSQENIAMAREARVRREAERAGVTNLTWGNVASSKGDGALLDLVAGQG